MICPNCFEKISERDLFCPFCGYQLRGRESANSSYQLNARLPEKTFLQSLMGAKYIARYKRAMGFPFDKHNVLHALENNSALSFNRLPDQLKTVYQSERDTAIPNQSQYVLSFENSGLLIMGVAEFIRQANDPVKGCYGFDDYNFHYTLHNQFIPKSQIDQVELRGNEMKRKLIVRYDHRQIRYVIPKTWRAKRFQAKNFRRLNRLVAKLH